MQKYSFKAEDLVDQGHLGDGAFGTVTKMLYPPTNTTMAVKVRHKIYNYISCMIKFFRTVDKLFKYTL